jgi:AraC-like DNA-binding protein/mannose-6-phosphate isomerase-like protein (cupin superfamily)
MDMKARQSLLRREPASVDVPEGEVRVLESHHAADFEMPLSEWPFHKVCWVAVGRGSLETPSASVPIRANDFLLLPADWSHRFVDDSREPLTLVILCISRKCLTEGYGGQLQALWTSALRRNDLGKPFRGRTAFHSSTMIESFRMALREQGTQRPGWESMLQTVAGRVIVRLARNHCEPSESHAASSMRSVEGAIEYIDTHLHENLQIEQIAARSHLSPRRFTTLFKQRTGLTFSHYLNRKRIEYACQRLDETGHILYACHGSGFNDVAYFYRVFKKQTGLTPGEYLRGSQV